MIAITEENMTHHDVAKSYLLHTMINGQPTR